MTEQVTQVPPKEEWPKWAIDCFIHEGKLAFKNEKKQVKYSNGRFVKGFGGGNPSGLSSDHAKNVQKIRSMGLSALHDYGMPKLIEHLQKEDLKTYDLVSIVKLLSDLCMPKQTESVDDNPKQLPQIIITQDAFDRAEQEDRKYREEARNAGGVEEAE